MPTKRIRSRASKSKPRRGPEALVTVDPYLQAWQALTPAERLRRSWRLRGRLPDLQAVHDAKTFPNLDGEVSVRDAVASDLEVLVRFNLAMARETEGIEIDAERLRAGVRAALRDPAKGRYWVAECDGAVVGGLLVTYEWSDWRNATFWWIQSVYVDPAHRGQGVFTALYRHVERLAGAAGCCGLRLYVHEHNERAREVYRRLGMVASGYRVLETPDVLKK